MGELAYRRGDYVVVPRGILHRWRFDERPHAAAGHRKRRSRSAPPARYCNERGQFLEHSPYCERDIRRPEDAWRRTTSRANSAWSSSSPTC